MKKTAIFLILGLFFFGACNLPVAVAQEPAAPKAPVSLWKGATAKQDLSPVLDSARRFDPGAHLFMVHCNGDGFFSDDQSSKKIDGRVNPEGWHYWFRNPDKKEKDIFVVRYNNYTGSYTASSNVMLFGDVRGSDKGDIVELWKVDSDTAVKKALDKAASIRQQSFQGTDTEYDLGYNYINNMRDLIFVWKLKFSYKPYKDPNGKYITPKDLIVYVDAVSGDILSYGPVRLDEP